MDQVQDLDALSNVLTELAENPFDISLHVQNIRLAQSLGDSQSALEMMTDFLSAGDDVWLPLLQAKEQSSVNQNTKEGVEELMALYERAEADYMSIPLLQRHLQYIINQHAKYSGDEPRPESLQDIFSTAWTRKTIDEIVGKGIGHLTQSHLLWDAQRDWEIQMLENASGSEKIELVERISILHLNRLRQPHSNSEDTFSSYSSFTTNYKPPQDYEPLMVAASKVKGQGVKSYDRRERNETALASYPLEVYAQYIAAERRAKYPDQFVINAVFERAISEAAKRRFIGEAGAEDALRSFWIGYCDSMRILEAEARERLRTFRRATRSVPSSGGIWARYMRFTESVEETINGLESVSDIYLKAISIKPLKSDVEQIVLLTLAFAGYQKRLLGEDQSGDVLPTLIQVLEDGIEMVHKASKTGDLKLRLEKFLAKVYEDSSLPDGAIGVWDNAVKKLKSYYSVWMQYTDTVIKYERYEEARSLFESIHTKQLDWPEVIWEAWIAFEHLYGSVSEIESCTDKIEKAQIQVNLRRAKEAERAAYQSIQIAAEKQANVPVTEVPIPSSSVGEVQMETDVQPTVERGIKRGPEDEPEQESNKKPRLEAKSQPLKRDRENCTVFVADLPPDTQEEDLAKIFKDCGSIKEVKITQLPNALVATVEFSDRDCIPAALTKDKKRINDQEIAVHLAWKSTLYVTNFPESMDDTAVRAMFGKYGTLFDVRWPSKKFKATRRFCYVQFTSPASAEKALELHNHKLDDNLLLNVYISNPERKKERTDQDANEREVFVAGLSRYTNANDLTKLFGTYGKVKEVRMAEEKGHSKGFAFIEFEEEKDATAALAANNYELKKRRIAVTLSNSRMRSKHQSEIGMTRVAEARSRSVRVKNLPPATQEGLLQQTLEKVARVKRVEVFLDKLEAVIELESSAEAGKLLLRVEPIVFNGNTLTLSEEGESSSAGSSSKPGGMFVPRRAGISRPKAGLGHPRASTSKVQGRSQDDFRKMVG